MKTSTQSPLLSIVAFATSVAHNSKTLKTAAAPYQAAFKTADAWQRKDLKTDWCIGFVMGDLDIDMVKAAQIVGKTRAERNAANPAWERAVNNAGVQFGNYVACNTVRATKKAAPVQQISIPRACKAGVAELIAAYGKDVVLAALKAAK